MINKDKLKAFRGWFAEHVAEDGYRQRLCTACLAHHAATWDGPPGPAKWGAPNDFARIFGVSAMTAYRIYNHPTHWSPTKDDALAMLDKLIETGKVEWPA